ncbi:MAG: lysine--tRNA ligase [archaeon]
MANLYHWADQVAQRVIAEKGDKKLYTLAAGITPSGVVHIGNFREIITVELVERALKTLGKKTRFIYSWDDYDVFRKVPQNLPKQDVLKKYLRYPVTEVPDTLGCHKSYAEHFEKLVEDVLPEVGVNPEYLYQHKMYQKSKYAEQIKFALNNADNIAEILNEYRKDKLSKDWLPIKGYCPKCKIDEIKFSDYDGKYNIKITCKCGFSESIDFRKQGVVKLPWRIDWPMRWKFEQVDFEPGGKEHSTEGGSFTTAKEIVKLFDWTAPTYQRYDFITVKGEGGKMSSSLGNVIDLRDALEIYEPEIVRWLFAGTRPNAEFTIAFDLDVLKVYSDFDKCERIFYGEEKVNEKQLEKQKRIYELSAVDKPLKKIPIQPSFRHLTMILQINGLDINQVVKVYDVKGKEDKEKIRKRATCAKNWIEKYAPEEFKFQVKEKNDVKLKGKEKELFLEIAKKLKQKDWTDKELHEEFYVLIKNYDVDNQEFFEIAYNIIVGKDKGPQLANFILTIGKEKIIKLFSSV